MHIDLQIHVYERLIHVSMFHWLLNIVLETIRESIIFLIHAYKLVYKLVNSFMCLNYLRLFWYKAYVIFGWWNVVAVNILISPDNIILWHR